MFRPARWRTDKNKIKAVFKLQFHATQVPQLNVDGLMLSVVPGDVGKPTVRLEKAVIQDGCCRWENPILQTVRFVQDPKTGKINGRIYHFIVSTGSTKPSFVGKVSIDFANYGEATKPSNISLPLNSNSKAVLHVSIQKLQTDFDQQRDVGEHENTDVRSQDCSLNAHLSNDYAGESIRNNLAEDTLFNKAAQNAELNRRASIGSDITMSSSDSSSGLDTPREIGETNNSIHQDPPNFSTSLANPLVLHNQTVSASTKIYEEPQRSEWEWSGGSDHGVSTDDSPNSSQDILPRDIEIEKLKAQIIALARQVDVSELELQTLRKQIVKESKRGQDLSKEVISLRQERDSFKAECEKPKAFKKCMDEAKVKNKLQYESGDPWILLEEIKQELTYEKDLNSNLRLQLQKTQESNSELMLAVQDLDELLEQKNKEIANLSSKSGLWHEPEEIRLTTHRSETDEDEDQKALEELVKEHKDAKETYLLEQKIMDLCSEREIYRREKDELEMQMEQLALDYEILKQENHDISYKLEQSQLQEQLKMQYECSSSFASINELEAQVESLENELRKQSKDYFAASASINELETKVESLENELKKQSKDYSAALSSINELENQVKGLEEELERQAQIFEVDLEYVMRAKVEQEQRAIQAEEALRRTRWRNADTAERLQEEFRRLSEQMFSTFDANEKVALKALAEANELRALKSQLEEMLKKANDDLQTLGEEYEAKLHELSDQLNSKTNDLEQIFGEIDAKSMQVECQKKHGEEVRKTLIEEIARLKADFEKLAMDKKFLHEQAKKNENLGFQLGHMKKSNKEKEELVDRGIVERNNLIVTIAMMRKDAEKFMEDLNRMRCFKDEKEKMVNLLHSQVESFKAQCNDFKSSLFEDEIEKEKFRKQVFQLKGDLKKKDDALSTIEKKLKDSNERSQSSNGTKATVRNNKLSAVPHGSKEVSSLKEKIKLLEGQIKLKETALESSTKLFLDKEKDLHDKIEELEGRLVDLNKNSASLCAYQSEKGAKDLFSTTLKSAVPGESRTTAEYLLTEECMSKESRSMLTSNKSKEFPSENESKASNIINSNLDGLLSELTSLKEKNKGMESELKEMQERYSEISLKFAEVEGERQKLVMTVRNLKNAKKS